MGGGANGGGLSKSIRPVPGIWKGVGKPGGTGIGSSGADGRTVGSMI